MNLWTVRRDKPSGHGIAVAVGVSLSSSVRVCVPDGLSFHYIYLVTDLFIYRSFQLDETWKKYESYEFYEYKS